MAGMQEHLKWRTMMLRALRRAGQYFIRFQWTRPRLIMVLVWVADVFVATCAMAMIAGFTGLLTHRAVASEVVVQQCLGFAFSAGIALAILGTHKTVWRYVSSADIMRVAHGCLLAAFLSLILNWLLVADAMFPFWASPGAAFVTFLLLTLIRVIGRSWLSGDLLAAVNRRFHGVPLVFLVGQVQKAVQVITSAKHQVPMTMRAVGIVDIEGRDEGRSVRGVPVLKGLNGLILAIEEVRRAGGNPQIVLMSPQSNPDEVKLGLEARSATNAPLIQLSAPDPARLDTKSFSHLDLLMRHPRRFDHQRRDRLFSGRRVLITGAGGTIGSELSRQIADLAPEKLILLDSSEYNLFRIDAAVEDLGQRKVALLGDIRDRDNLFRVFEAHRPDIILHAAALKHVPLMEENPSEAVLTNVLGLQHTLAAAEHMGCGTFVFVSTDKAVEPSSIMGATKRVGELFMAAWRPNRPMARGFVRFGNVLGSNGSVSETFQRQIQQGGPVTVTHAEMTRYFMTSSEAGGLVLQAAALAAASPSDGVSAFLLDMGEPVSVLDLAIRMIQFSGLKPHTDIRIEFLGLRKGEKLTESLIYPFEKLVPTEADGVMGLSAPFQPDGSIRQHVAELIQDAQARNDAEVRRRLASITSAAGQSPELGLVG